MVDFEKLRYVQNNLETPAQYEQLAEECVELAHACLKLARIFRGENPTPADVVDVGEKIYEEVADVLLHMKVIGLEEANLQARQLRKLERWYQRLKEKGEEDGRDESDLGGEKKYDEWFGWHLLEGYSDDLDYVIRLARVRREMGDAVKVVRKTEEITEMEVDWDGNEASAGGGDQPGRNG